MITVEQERELICSSLTLGKHLLQLFLFERVRVLGEFHQLG